MSGGAAPAQESSGPRKNAFGEAQVEGVDLNLTALMDILSNLLFFLLASFGATIVMAINVNTPVQSADKSDVADTKQSVTVNVKMTPAGFEVSATGTQQSDDELAPLKKSIPNIGPDPDYATLSAHLMAIKEKYPRSETMILTPETGVQYAAIVHTMDIAREKEVRVGMSRKVIKILPTVVVSSVVK